MTKYEWNKNEQMTRFGDFAECQTMLHGVRNTNRGWEKSNEKGISALGSVIATVLAVVIAAMILIPFEMEGMPLFIAFILIFSLLGERIACFFDEKGV